MMKPFRFTLGTTVNIDVSGSSQSILVSNDDTKAVRVMNNGTATAWLRFAPATGSTASVSTDVPIGPGVTEVFTITTGGPIWASVIAAGATGRIYFTPGDGI